MGMVCDLMEIASFKMDQTKLDGDRFKTILDIWKQGPRDLIKKWYHDKSEDEIDRLTKLFGLYETAVYCALWGEAYSKKKGSRENYLATGPMSLSQIMERSRIKSKTTVVKALKNLYELQFVQQIRKGGYHSKGSEYRVLHIPKPTIHRDGDVHEMDI